MAVLVKLSFTLLVSLFVAVLEEMLQADVLLSVGDGSGAA